MIVFQQYYDFFQIRNLTHHYNIVEDLNVRSFSVMLQISEKLIND